MPESPFLFLSRWLARSKDHPDRRAGDDARDRRAWQEAADAYRRYLRRRPAHTAVWLRLGNMLKEVGDTEEAHAAYERAGQLEPLSGAGPRLRGDLALRSGDPAAAATHFFEAWTRDRDAAAGRALVQPALHAHLAGLQSDIADDLRITGGVDGLRNLSLEGWAWNPADPDTPVWVEISAEGRPLARVRADRYRFDILDVGLGPEQCGFAVDLGPILASASLRTLEVRVAGEDVQIAGSPFELGATEGLQRWLQRPVPFPGVPGPPLISIITPVHDVRLDWFEETVTGVLRQADGRWEWVVVDDGSAPGPLKARLQTLSADDARIRVLTLPAARGTAAATNIGLQAATAGHVLFLDHDDQLEVEAVGRLAAAAGQGADLIYGDEILTGTDLRDLRLLTARPAFSWRYYLSHPYFVHPVCVRRDLALAVGFDESLAISADVDFILRVLEHGPLISHQPGMLYRWRTHARSAGHSARNEVTNATIGALGRHFARLGVRAEASPGAIFNTYRIDFHDPGGRVLVVIPTRNRSDLVRSCIESLRLTTNPDDVDLVVIDHDSTESALADYLAGLGQTVRVMPYSGVFNYSRMNNQAVARFLGDHRFVLFLNNDIEALTPGWLERMRALAAMKDVGAVGATLLYPDGRVQHAGVVIGPGGYAEHAMKFEPFEVDGRRHPGYGCSLTAVRDWSAVTGACLMMRSDVFRDIGGFDELLPVGFNDTDLCLRLKAQGLNIVNDGWAVLRHHESATRAADGDLAHPEDAATFAARWKDLIETGDPFYNPVLSIYRDHAPEHPDTDRLQPRMTSVNLSAAADG